MHPTLEDLGISEDYEDAWREQVGRGGALGLARRLLSIRGELGQVHRQLKSVENQLALMTHEAYLLVGYEQTGDGGFKPQEDKSTSDNENLRS